MSSNATISSRNTRFFEEIATVAPSHIAEVAASHHVLVILEKGFERTFTGQAILFMLLNLLVRLGWFMPKVIVEVNDAEVVPQLTILGDGSYVQRLQSFLNDLPGGKRLQWQGPASAHTRVVISPKHPSGSLSLWADGWVCYLNEDVENKGDPSNPIGAFLAGALGAAEVFKQIVKSIPLKQGFVVRFRDSLAFSAFDYSLSPGLNPPLREGIDLSDCFAVGLGGIASGLILVLSCVPSLDGSITLIDHDDVEESNLNRYVIATLKDIGKPKADLCSTVLGKLHSYVIRSSYQDFVSRLGEKRLPLVLVSVDNDAVRREIQSDVPRVILNAGTGDVVWRLSRHDFQHLACLGCISRADRMGDPVAIGLSRQLGLPLELIERFLSSREPVPTEVLASSGRLSRQEVEELSGQPLQTIRERLCGWARLVEGEEAVSLPFLSAFPGVLLAGELLKEKGFARDRPFLNTNRNHLVSSILAYPHERSLMAIGKRQGCDCTRAAFQEHYQRKWIAV